MKLSGYAALLATGALVLGLAQGALADEPRGTVQAAEPQAHGARPKGSLYSQDSPSLVADLRAHRVGDTITILVQESASASSSAATKTSKDESVNFGGVTGALSGLFRPLGIKHNLLGAFGVTDKNASNGAGQTNRSGSLVTRITVTVKEVLANGNLKIEGVRMVGVNQEKQKITISGVVRQEDVSPDNTVSSIAIADMTVQFDGKGPVADQQKQGLITRLFKWLF